MKAKSQAPSAGPSGTKPMALRTMMISMMRKRKTHGEMKRWLIVEKITSLINVRQTRMIDGVLEIGN